MHPLVVVYHILQKRICNFADKMTKVTDTFIMFTFDISKLHSYTTESNYNFILSAVKVMKTSVTFVTWPVNITDSLLKNAANHHKGVPKIKCIYIFICPGGFLKVEFLISYARWDVRWRGLWKLFTGADIEVRKDYRNISSHCLSTIHDHLTWIGCHESIVVFSILSPSHG